MKQVAAAKIRRAEEAAQARASLRRRARRDAARSDGGGRHRRSSVHEAGQRGRAGRHHPDDAPTKGSPARSTPTSFAPPKSSRREPQRRRAIIRSASKRATPCAAWASPTVRAWPLGGVKDRNGARGRASASADDFVHGTISEIVLVSQKLVTMMSQRPRDAQARAGTRRRSRSLRSERRRRAEPRRSRRRRVFARRPSSCSRACCPKYLEFTIYSAMLETDAAFFAAQLVAMTNATDNASKLIDELTIADEQRPPSGDHQGAPRDRRRRRSVGWYGSCNGLRPRSGRRRTAGTDERAHAIAEQGLVTVSSRS